VVLAHLVLVLELLLPRILVLVVVAVERQEQVARVVLESST
jgi:hypothetical protein